MYRGTEAYDFSLFEPMVVEQPKKNNKTEAPSKRKAPAKKQAHKNGNVSKVLDNYQCTVERKTQSAGIPVAVKKAMCFCLVCFCMMVALLVMQTRCDTLMSEIADTQSQIKIAQSENVRLNAELSSMMSSDKVEDYAENVLGMVKAESYQISYIDLSEGDEIVVSGDKSLDNDSPDTSNLKTLLAYIF